MLLFALLAAVNKKKKFVLLNSLCVHPAALYISTQPTLISIRFSLNSAIFFFVIVLQNVNDQAQQEKFLHVVH